MSYRAPLQDMLFVMRELAGLAQIQALPGFADATDETVEAVLGENARLMTEVIAPLNHAGDEQPHRRRVEVRAGIDGHEQRRRDASQPRVPRRRTVASRLDERGVVKIRFRFQPHPQPPDNTGTIG